MRGREGRLPRNRSMATIVVAILILMASSGRAGQKNKKPDDADKSASPLPAIPMSVSDQIDHDIGDMLGAFQLGDLEGMHKYYADDATFVSGVYAPPVMGWKNYAALYEREKAAYPGMQLIRRNTLIFVHGDVSWASYQWEFDSALGGKPFTARGQTTLVLNKVGDRWLIVHNHTSEICPEMAPAQGQIPTPAPPQAGVPKP